VAVSRMTGLGTESESEAAAASTAGRVLVLTAVAVLFIVRRSLSRLLRLLLLLLLLLLLRGGQALPLRQHALRPLPSAVLLATLLRLDLHVRASTPALHWNDGIRDHPRCAASWSAQTYGAETTMTTTSTTTTKAVREQTTGTMVVATSSCILWSSRPRKERQKGEIKGGYGGRVRERKARTRKRGRAREKGSREEERKTMGEGAQGTDGARGGGRDRRGKGQDTKGKEGEHHTASGYALTRRCRRHAPSHVCAYACTYVSGFRCPSLPAFVAKRVLLLSAVRKSHGARCVSRDIACLRERARCHIDRACRAVDDVRRERVWVRVAKRGTRETRTQSEQTGREHARGKKRVRVSERKRAQEREIRKGRKGENSTPRQNTSRTSE